MKILGFILLLSLVHPAQAQIFKKRQSISSVRGLIERIFGKTLPYEGLVLDLKNPAEASSIELAAHSHALRIPNLESNFSFTNNKPEFRRLFTPDMGLCRGVSSLRKKFRILGFFDPENKLGQIVPDKTTEPKEYEKFYKKLVKQLRNREVTIFPGFKNLQELSSDPNLTDMMKLQVYDEWRTKNFSKGTGLGKILKGSIVRTKYEKMLEVRERVEAFQNLNHNTTMVIAQKLSGWIHILEAVAVTPVAEDGSFTFTFWNDKFLELDKIYSTLTVTADGEMRYEDGIESREIFSGGIAKENDGETLDMSEKLQKYIEINGKLFF